MNLQYKERLDKIEEVLGTKLPVMFSDSWRKSFFGEIPDAVSNLFMEQLTVPCRDLVQLGGKRWRPLLQVLCFELISKSEPLYSLVPLVEFVHTASLIHDDIEDSSDTRRGKPAAYITYGTDVAINSGSWLYFAASECIDSADIPESLKNILYRVFFTELRRLHLGQAMDIYWHRNKGIIPSEDEYLSMTRMKTGTLASLSAKTGILSAGGSLEAADFMGKTAASIGIGFQILDDVINLTTGNKGKKRGDDIVEGKKSLPLLLHLKERPQDAGAVLSCFERAAAEGADSPAVEECIGILSSSGAIRTAYERSCSLIEESCSKIAAGYKGSKSAELITDLFAGMLEPLKGICC